MLTSPRRTLPVLAVALAAVLCTGVAPSAASAAAVTSARDRDGDHLPDRWERRHGLSTKHRSGRGDPDHDALRNRGEHRRRTDPRKADTDGDGVKDGREVRRGTNPRKAPRARQGGFPNPASTGVPAGWQPKQTRSGDLHVRRAGAVVKDVLLQGGDLVVDAPNVTVRRVKLQGGTIENFRGGSCQNGLTVENTSIEPAPGQDAAADTEGVISAGGYTARRVEIWRRAEGFRVSGSPDCGPVRVEDSFAKIVIPDGRCDLHSDGLQGYDGGPVAVAQRHDRLHRGRVRDGAVLRPRRPGQHERHRRPAPRGRRRIPVPDGGAGERPRTADRRPLVGVRTDQRRLLAPQRLGGRDRPDHARLPGDAHGPQAALQHAGRGLSAYQRTTWGESAPAM